MTTAWGLYGQSLYDLAVEEKADEQIMEELDAVRGIFAENPDYITLLCEPSIPVKNRTQLLDEAFGGQIHPYLLNFLKILVEKGMLRGFSTCCSTYRSSYNKDHGISEATVISAVPLNDEQASALQAMGNSIPQYSATMATVIVVVGPVIIAYPFFQKYFIKGLTVGSVKG